MLQQRSLGSGLIESDHSLKAPYRFNIGLNCFSQVPNFKLGHLLDGSGLFLRLQLSLADEDSWPE